MTDNKRLNAAFRRSRLVTIADGSHVELRALVMSDWATIQEEAAQARKRELIETYSRNLDLIPEPERLKTLMEAFRRAEEIRCDNILSEEVSAWLVNTIRGQLTATWLSMRGANPRLTFDDVCAVLQHEKAEQIEELANIVGELSRNVLGNGRPPQSETTAGAEMERPEPAASAM